MISNRMPETEAEIREIVKLAFPVREDGYAKSWCERKPDEQLAFIIIGSEYGPYIVTKLLKLLDEARARKQPVLSDRELEEIRRDDIRGQVELPYATRAQCMDALVHRLFQPDIGMAATACVVRSLQGDVARLLDHIDSLK